MIEVKYCASSYLGNYTREKYREKKFSDIPSLPDECYTYNDEKFLMLLPAFLRGYRISPFNDTRIHIFNFSTIRSASEAKIHTACNMLP